MDARFSFPSSTSVGKSGGAGNGRDDRQDLLSVQHVEIEPSLKTGNSYEFDLSSNNAVLFGPLSGFKVTASFTCKNTATADEETIPLTDYNKVRLMPNWFEACIKSIDVFHVNSSLKCSDTPPYADQFLNTYLYSYMDEFTKKYMFPEECSTGNAVFTKRLDWGVTDGSSWHKYSKKIFGKEQCTFRYIPIHLFPFFQQPNFVVDGKPPNALPMSLLNKLAIRITFTDTFDHIFRKVGTNTKIYNVKFSDIMLLYEEARVSLPFERQFLSSKRVLPYSGVTKFGVAENVPSGAFNHRLRFQDVLLPEGIFIFSLPKTVVGGQFKYSTDTSEDVFAKHNIKEVELAFAGMPFHIKAPHLGSVESDIVEIKMLLDHLETPPFGMLQDPKLLTYEAIKSGANNTPFPHIYINLCPSGKGTRVVPVSDSGKAAKSHSDLDLTLKFGAGGAVTDVTYFVYIFYTDYNISLDMKTLRFKPQYNRLRPIT